MKKDILSELKKNQIILNIFVWVVLCILLALPFGLPNSVGLIMPLIPAVYIHFLLVKKFYRNKKYYLYILFTLATICIFGYMADNIIHAPRISIINDLTGFTELNTTYSFIDTAGFNPLIAIIISSIIKHFNDLQNKQIQEIKTQKIKTELELLKSQVNPHFFFNTLNTLYSMVMMKGDEETAEGISQLSGLMRYMIYDTKVDLISLDKEVEHIENFIELQKLRFDQEDELDVKFEILGETKSKTVPPMLFIPFIENAYKHGLSTKQKNEIFIQVDVMDEDLKFRVMNTVNNKKKSNPEHSGIGIENVTKRLEILFPQTHVLRTSQDSKYFNVYLSFPINNA